ncbi:MAG TPA: hypothetical protein VMT53_11405 [Terriglobales bacterium]|nr:hypothetical protein [Terriglobales bacterium]
MTRDRATVLPLLFFLGTVVSLGQTQPAPIETEAVQVTGLSGVKQNTKGSLKVENGSLSFVYSKGNCDLPAASIQDVVTGRDSQRVIGGTVGTLSRLAPYGGGTAMSLLRTKLDTITIQYQDSNGGLHGAIFTLPVGHAEAIKEQLLAQGARTSIPSKPEPTTDPSAQSEAKEQLR